MSETGRTVEENKSEIEREHRKRNKISEENNGQEKHHAPDAVVPEWYGQ